MSITLTSAPIEDTYLRCSQDYQYYANYGGYSTLECGPQRAILLRFQINGIPAGSTIEQVSLELTKNGWAVTGTNYLREVTTNSWTEFGACWAMAIRFWRYWREPIREPLHSGKGFGTGRDYGNTNISTLNSNAADPDGTVLIFTSTAAFVTLLQAYAGASGQLDLCSPIGSGFVCDSRHSTNPPQLKVTYRLAPPAISSFSPLSTSSTGTTINISGSNFGPGASTLDNITLVNQGAGSDYDLDNRTWASSSQISGDVPAAAVPDPRRRVTRA